MRTAVQTQAETRKLAEEISKLKRDIVDGVEGITLREALQKIVLDEDVDWVWEIPDDMDVDHEQPNAIIDVNVDGNTPKQDRELLKEAKKIWNEIDLA